MEELQVQPDASPKRPRSTAGPVPFRRHNDTQQVGITSSLADEEDQLLQVRVNASAEYGHRYVRVTNAPDHTLRFIVERTYSGSADEIAEWQARRWSPGFIPDQSFYGRL
jgi:predicted metal-dependent phosphoesterase TrpH